MALPLLDPKIDVVFKALLQDLPEAIADMIECVVDLPGPIASVVVLNRDAPLVHPEDTHAVLDVLVEVTGFGRVNVEMQRVHRAYNPARFLYYWAREYGRALKRGVSYSELPRVVSILWHDHILDAEGPFHSVYRIREDTTHRIYCPNLEIHTLELPKWQIASKSSAFSPPSRLDRWSHLFANANAARASIKKSDIIMERIMTKLGHISQEETLRILAENRERDLEMYEWSLRQERKEGLQEGVEKGKREGLQEGVEKGQRKALCKLLVQRFGPLSDDVLATIASADTTALDAMLTRVLTAQVATDVLP
jgi:predicted transposase/invertase (TIGR01784 family)